MTCTRVGAPISIHLDVRAVEFLVLNCDEGAYVRIASIITGSRWQQMHETHWLPPLTLLINTPTVLRDGRSLCTPVGRLALPPPGCFAGFQENAHFCHSQNDFLFMVKPNGRGVSFIYHLFMVKHTCWHFSHQDFAQLAVPLPGYTTSTDGSMRKHAYM